MQTNEQRRRSTRLSQLVPLVVRGMDLLGQPFEEHTTTMNFNFHGCAYASRHHLPRNTWISIEPLQQGFSSETSCVRARVVWTDPSDRRGAQTSCEQFQIAVELEAPANIWGVAPPEDWQGQNMEANTYSNSFASSSAYQPVESGNYYHEQQSATGMQEPMQQGVQQNAGDPSPYQPPYQEPSGPLSGAPSSSESRGQIDQQAAEAVDNALAGAKERIEQVAERAAQERLSRAEEMFQAWREQFESTHSMAGAQFSTELSDRLGAFEQEMRMDLKMESDAERHRLAEMAAALEQRSAVVREELNAAETALLSFADLSQRVEEMKGQLDQHIAQASVTAQARIEQASAEALQGRLQEEMRQARGQWDELLASSLDSAVQRLSDRLAESSQSLLAGAERQIDTRLSELTRTAGYAINEAREAFTSMNRSLEHEVANARATLTGLEESSARIKGDFTQFESRQRAALEQLQIRVDDVLRTQTAELNRRAENLVSTLAERVMPSLESAGQQFISQAIEQTEARLGTRLEQVRELLRELSGREMQGEESLRLFRERLRQSAENSERDFGTQCESTLMELRNDLQSARTDAFSGWNAELNASRDRALRGADESLAASAQIHMDRAQERIALLAADGERAIEEALDRKAQSVASEIDAHGFAQATQFNTNLQVAAEETVGNSRRQIEEAAQETARRIAGELETHAVQLQAQLEGAAGETIHDSQARIQQAAEAAAASFGQVVSGISGHALDQFLESSRGSVEARTADLQQSAARFHQEFEQSAAASADRMRGEILSQVQQNLAEMSNGFRAECQAALESMRSGREGLQQEWRASLETMSGELVQKYYERLETVSNSWQSDSLRRLSEQGQDLVQRLSRTGEQVVRNSFTRIFDGMAEAVRENLGGSVTNASAPAGPIPNAESGSQGSENHIHN